MKIVFGAFLLSLLLFAGVRELLDPIPQDPEPLTAAPFIAAKHNQDSVPSSPAEGGLPHDSVPTAKMIVSPPTSSRRPTNLSTPPSPGSSTATPSKSESKAPPSP